jgi:hypothetical protein
MERIFSESVKFDGRVNKETNTIHNIAVLTSLSLNNRIYTPSALKSIVPLINGTKSFVDHAYEPQGHSIMSLLGEFRNPRLDGTTVRADLTILKSSQGRNIIFDLAEHFPHSVGFSIYAKGRFNENPDSSGREVVEEIISLRSIDLVTEPATTHGLFEELSEARAKIKKLKSELRVAVETKSSFKVSQSGGHPGHRGTKEELWRELNKFL